MNTIQKPFVVAEIGCNHMGSLDTAIQMVHRAAECGAHAAKFQKRCPKELLTEQQYNAPHPNPAHSYGATYGEHRERLELTIKQHQRLAKECEAVGVAYSTSVWDMTSAKEVVKKIDPPFIKVPSACNAHFDLIRFLDRKYEGDIHISVGMRTRSEVGDLASLIGQTKHPERYVVYACTSGYPVPFDKVYLLEIPYLIETFREPMGCDIGFSGHHLGIAVDVAAYALGARYVERHFTLDRTWKGSDHAASLEPSGLQKLCRDLRATHDAMQVKPKKLDKIEVEQREKLAYRPR